MNLNTHHETKEGRCPVNPLLQHQIRDVHAIVMLSMECYERFLKPNGIWAADSYLEGLREIVNG
jgi:hypothetical protein